jgi:putative cell wall-binding protein
MPPPRLARVLRVARIRALLAILMALGLAGGLALPGTARPTRAATQLKAVIIVGPTGSLTSGYESSADAVAAAAAANGMAVTKLYTPNATWANVAAATAGANLVYFAGHGNGFPNPYVNFLQPQYNDGYGLDPGKCSSATDCPTYYGEQYVSQVKLAPNAIVLLNHLCYAPGASEPGNPVPSLSVAVQRADNFAAGFLAAGAGAVFAADGGDFPNLVNALFSSAATTTMDQLFEANGFNGTSDQYLPSSRTGWARIHIDPESGGLVYTHVVTGDLGLTVADWSGGDAPDPDRYSGADRYGTAAAVATGFFKPSISTAFVATGANFPDALAGAAAAGKAAAPILLTEPDALPAATIQALQVLKPANIVILGGTGVVSSAVASALKQYATSGTVSRLAGADRYATAAAIAKATFPSGSPTVYVATGETFPDALAGSAVASGLGSAVVLVAGDVIPTPTMDVLRTTLKPSKLVILGGSGVVPDSTVAQLAAATGASVERLWGPDRYATAVAISQAAYPSGAKVVFLATGVAFPDALAGAPLGGPLLLVSPNGAPQSVLDEVARLKPTRIVTLGGTGAVPVGVEDQVKAAAGLG